MYGTTKLGALQNHLKLFFPVQVITRISSAVAIFWLSQSQNTTLRLTGSYDVFGLCEHRKENSRLIMIILKHVSACRGIIF